MDVRERIMDVRERMMDVRERTMEKMTEKFCQTQKLRLRDSVNNKPIIN